MSRPSGTGTIKTGSQNRCIGRRHVGSSPGLDPTEIPNYLARLNTLSADAAIPLTVSPNANRPHAENKTYTYKELENVSVEQAAGMINGGDAKLVVGKAEGLLGESAVAGSRAYFVSPNILALLIMNELNLSAVKRPMQLQLSDSSATKFGIEMNPTQPTESLIVRMLGGTPDTSYQVILDGHSVGQVETDRRGRGRLVVNKDTLTQAMQAKQAGKQKVRLEVGSLISTDLSVELS